MSDQLGDLDMATRKVMKACMDYMIENHIHPSDWKTTEKSLVYVIDGERVVIPLSKILDKEVKESEENIIEHTSTMTYPENDRITFVLLKPVRLGWNVETKTDKIVMGVVATYNFDVSDNADFKRYEFRSHDITLEGFFLKESVVIEGTEIRFYVYDPERDYHNYDEQEDE